MQSLSRYGRWLRDALQGAEPSSDQELGRLDNMRGATHKETNLLWDTMVYKVVD